MTDGVMVVDDDDDIRETISQLLERHGYDVVTAAHGGEAMKMLQNGDHPSLILLDLMMPNVSGEEFRRMQLADLSVADIPVVLLSGAGRVEQIAARMSVEVLPKPIELTKLVETVRRFCTASSTRKH
jgi:CheY-like chemotaxis protein